MFTGMFAKMFAFEWRYYLRQPSFYITSLIFFLLPFGFMAFESPPLAGGGNVLANGPFAITQMILRFGIFAMFLVVNFAAGSAIRNETSGMSEILYSKPFKPMGYQLGHLIGAYCVTLMVFAMVPLGLFLGSLMPWIDSQRMGPYHLSYYLLPFIYFAVPGLFVLSCLFYTAALKFRSMMSAYLVAVAMFMAYRVSRTVLSGPEYREIAALADPFGVSTFAEVSRYWTVFEKNQAIIEFAGTIGANRILWLVIGIAILLIFGGFHRRLELPSKKIKKPKKNAKAEVSAPVGNNISYQGSGNNNWSQFITRLRFEMKQVLRSAPFYVLITMCIFVVIMQFINPNGMYGTPDWPFTHNMVNLVIGGFSLVTIIIIAYYSAEVVWRERGVGIGDITDSMPVANLTFWLSKLLAVCLVVVVMHLIGMVVTVTYQLIKGHENIEIGQYLVSLLYFQALPMCLSVVAAFFIQVLSPSKNIGMLFFVGFFTISQLLGSMGLEHNMYSIGASPTMLYSDLNGYGVYLASHHWYMLYWVALAVAISVVGYGLWHRGPQQSLKARARLMPYHFGKTGKWVLSVSMAVFVLSGSYIVYNTRVLNEFVSTDQANDNSADYEKEYIAYQHATLPMITDVNATVDIFPEQRKIVASAKIKVSNTSDQPIEKFLVNSPSFSPQWSVEIQGGKIGELDERFDTSWFTFSPPLQPGESRTGEFTVTRKHVGFKDRGEDTSLVANGTFINNFELFPSFGFNAGGRLTDRRERKNRGLEPIQRANKLEDKRFYKQSFFGAGVGQIAFEATVSTSKDQFAIAPGYLQKEWVEGDRRYFHYKMDAPMVNFYSFLSARLEVQKQVHNGVNVEVYYHKTHGMNVDILMQSVKDSIDYFNDAFGPYQYRQMRIIEFPGYRRFAQSFANTVPFSESISFSADLRDATNIDPVYYITAHEMAHQWWGHQVRGADVQGAAILSETLSQYSALMVMRKKYGAEKLRLFLKYELDRYLRGRTLERLEEMPMLRSESQGYIHYRKGSIVMMALLDRLGEQRINAVLKGFLTRYKNSTDPYPTTLDLVGAFKAGANENDQQFIADLFETITLYDLKAEKMASVATDDGQFEVTLTVFAKRFTADGQGKETSAVMNEMVDIVLFKNDPEDFAAKDSVIYSQKHRLVEGENVLILKVAEEPKFGGVDPFIKFIDRDSADNVVKL